MDFEEEYKQNRTQMKKIKKDDTIFFIVFICNIIIAVWLFIAFVLMGYKGNLLISLLAAAASIAGFLSVYKKNSSLSIVSGALLLAEIIVLFFSGGFNILGVVELAVFAWVAVRSFMNIKKYRWLEQQDGFPNFEPTLKEYDMNKVQWGIKDPYAQKMEERQKSSTSSMDEL